MKLKHILLALTVVLIGWFIYDSFSQPGPDDLEGDFKETAFYRNENNTGPIIRIYAVTVSDTLWSQMQQYGEYMPHTKYGNTKVYFFPAGKPASTEVQPGNQPIPAPFRENCLGVYEKDAMSQVTFTRYPFSR